MGWVRATIVISALAVLLPTASADVRIEGFATDLPGNEDAVLLRNVGAETIALEQATLADGNGELRFPPNAVLAPGSPLYVTTNRTSFEAAFGEPPHFALDDPDPAKKMVMGSRAFALANAGDVLSLIVDGQVEDVVAYGDEEGTIAGWIGDPIEVPGTMDLRWFPRTSAHDTDAAADWTPQRRSYAGEDLFETAHLDVNGSFFPYVSPEHSRVLVRNTLLSAERSIRLNVYQFRDIDLASSVADHMRAHPGLRVDVLLDASPVGESREELSERGHVIEQLVAAGASVHMFTHSRYAYNHAKYAVIDDEILLVQTENFVPSGIPADGRSGNRGWGIVVANSSLAQAAAKRFDADFEPRPYGSRAAGDREKPPFPAPALGRERGSVAPGVRIDATVRATLLTAPFERAGRGDPIESAIRNATASIEVLQLDLAPRWRSPTADIVPHPYLDALIDAARRGVNVRILLDGHFLDESATGDNADTVALVRDDFPGLPIEARLRSGSASVLHAKALVVDGHTTLVGSMNWNSNSILQNRELGLILESASLAAFYRSSFEQDWRDAAPAGIPHLDVVTVLTLAGLAMVFRGPRPR